MQEYKIKLNSIREVKEFVGFANNYAFDIDLVSGRYAVDGKSIMGIFSLDLSKILTMRVHSGSREGKEFAEDVAKFIVD